MTLHKAIEKVLLVKKSELTTREIADEINRRRLYRKGDGTDVSASQISARINKYPALFVRQEKWIRLNKFAVVE